MDLSPERLRILQIFFPYAASKYLDMTSGNGRFVHYTTAEAAVNMIRTKEVWMRNATAVNDFMEIEHGIRCLTNAYNGALGERFKIALNKIFPGFTDELEQKFNGWLPHFRTDTFITSVSEHLSEEDTLGRLSMWRAYGGSTGIAVVLNQGPFLSQSDALKAYTSPVAYKSIASFGLDFEKVVQNIETATTFIESIGRDQVMASVFAMLRFSILCTKHPGFSEEREWRVVCSPAFERSDRLIEDIQIIRGTPQKIYKIPLKNVPEQGLLGAEVAEIVERVIVGPTQYPTSVKDAVVSLLESAGVQNAATKVFVSDIPLRH